MSVEATASQPTGTEILTPPPAPSPSEPSTRTLTLGGTPREVPADLADAIARELNSRDGRHGSELQRLRQEMQALREQMTPPAPEPPAPQGPTLPKKDLLLNDPEEWQRQTNQYWEARFNDGLTAVQQQALQREQMLVAEQQRQQAWQSEVAKFYREHPDLVGKEDLVDMVYQRSFQELSPKPVPEAMKEIADRTRARLKELGVGSGPSRTPQLESGRPRAASPTQAPERNEPEIGGLSKQIRAIQERMRGNGRAA